MIVCRGLQSKLASALCVLPWLAALGCASTRPAGDATNDVAMASSRAHRAHEIARAQTSIRRLIDEGRYPAAESLAAGLVTPAATTFADSSEIADVLDLQVQAMVMGGRCWEPQALEAIDRSLAIRSREPGTDSLRLAGSLFALGHLRGARWDNRGAIEAYQRSLRLRERALGPAHPGVLASMRRIGMERLQLDDRQGADSVLKQSAGIAERALARDDPGRIEGDLALAMLAELQGSTDTTLYASVVARTERVFGPEHPLLAEPLRRYSELLRNIARYTRAHQLMARAHAIYERALGPHNLRTAMAWNLIGVNHVWSGRDDLSLPYFEESFATIRALLGPDHLETCMPYQDLGLVRCWMGDEATGIPLLERAFEIADRSLPPDHWLVSLALYHLGGGYLAAGRDREARPILERLLAIRTRTHPAVSMEVGRAMDLLAQAGGDPQRLRELREGAARIYLSLYGPDHPLGGRALEFLSWSRWMDGDTLGAIQLCDSSIAVVARTRGPNCQDVGWGFYTLGRFYRAAGYHADAARSFERSAAAFAKSAGPASMLTAMSTRDLAHALVATGRLSEAFRIASRAEAIRRDHLASNARLMPESEALTLLGSSQSSRAAGLHVMLSLAAGPLSGDPDVRREACDALIRSRAMVLDEMGVRHRSWAVGADSEVAGLAARFDSCSRQVSKLEVRGPDPDRVEEFLARLDRARAARDRAERVLAEHSAQFRNDRARARLGLDSVAAFLPRGTALIAYVGYQHVERRDGRPVTTPSFLAFVLGSDGVPAVVPLGKVANIDSLVAAWRREVDWGEAQRHGERTAERRYRQTAARLRKAVWDPVAAHLGNAGRVFVVPGGSLSLVNMATLPVGSSEYVLERGPSIHYLTAERDLALGMESVLPGRGLLAMGAPAFDSSATPQGRPAAEGPIAVNGYRGPLTDCVTFGQIHFMPLPASGGELEAIADLWRHLQPSTSRAAEPNVSPVDVLTGPRAAESEFRARAPGHRVVHLATHGFFVGDQCQEAEQDARGIGGMVPGRVAGPTPPGIANPLRFSGLALAGANLRAQAPPDQDDGILTAEEIASMDLTAVQWAVLSGCETGVGEQRSGEGMMGFRRAFHIAGARTTIMSLWRVRDRTAARWMRALYESRWRRGLDSAESVREASLAELRTRRAAGLSTHPVHWGAFIAVGDWR